jgi:hypothetical protein
MGPSLVHPVVMKVSPQWVAGDEGDGVVTSSMYPNTVLDLSRRSWYARETEFRVFAFQLSKYHACQNQARQATAAEEHNAWATEHNESLIRAHNATETARQETRAVKELLDLERQEFQQATYNAQTTTIKSLEDLQTMRAKSAADLIQLDERWKQFIREKFGDAALEDEAATDAKVEDASATEDKPEEPVTDQSSNVVALLALPASGSDALVALPRFEVALLPDGAGGGRILAVESGCRKRSTGVVSGSSRDCSNCRAGKPCKRART